MPALKALYEVGGCVRDELLGVATKDIDLAAEITGVDNMHQALSFLEDWCDAQGYERFVTKPEFATVRARFPKGHEHSLSGLTVDFVVCRSDGPYSDGRHPDYVEVGDLYTDLARRDFTMNAMARPFGTHKELIDPHDGQWDLQKGILRFVGEPMDRLREDGIRALRAIRFMITKDLIMAGETKKAVCSAEVATLLDGVHEDRARTELNKCFAFDTARTIAFLGEDLHRDTLEVIFNGKLKFKATSEDM